MPSPPRTIEEQRVHAEKAVRASLSSRVHPAAGRDHGGLERMVGMIRKPLSELLTNIVRLRDLGQRERRDRIPRTSYRCRLYENHICNCIVLKMMVTDDFLLPKIPTIYAIGLSSANVCWKEHIAAIPIK